MTFLFMWLTGFVVYKYNDQFLENLLLDVFCPLFCELCWITRPNNLGPCTQFVLTLICSHLSLEGLAASPGHLS